jgi:hypothetical protein
MAFIRSVTLPTSGIASLSGFSTPDDFQHVVVELYFTGPLQPAQLRDVLWSSSGAGPLPGMAGSYSSDDGVRHVTGGSDERILYKVIWSAQVVPEVRTLATLDITRCPVSLISLPTRKLPLLQ